MIESMIPCPMNIYRVNVTFDTYALWDALYDIKAHGCGQVGEHFVQHMLVRLKDIFPVIHEEYHAVHPHAGQPRREQPVQARVRPNGHVDWVPVDADGNELPPEEPPQAQVEEEDFNLDNAIMEHFRQNDEAVDAAIDEDAELDDIARDLDLQAQQDAIDRLLRGDDEDPEGN